MENVTLISKNGDYSIYQSDTGKTVLIKDCRARHVYSKPGYYIAHSCLAGQFNNPVLQTAFRTPKQAAQHGIKHGANLGENKLRPDYGDQRDYRKIDIFWRGSYKASTNRAKDLREAKLAFWLGHRNLAISEIVTKYA